MKHTKIITTLGPATDTKEKMTSLLAAGANIFRFNFSHQTHEYHKGMAKVVEEIRAEGQYNPAIMLDTKGPEIRSGFASTPFMVEAGQMLKLTPDFDADYHETGALGVSYDGLSVDVKVGDAVLIDSGMIVTVVEKIEGKDVTVRVTEGGKIKSHRHINLPSGDVSLPSITEQDWADLSCGVEIGMDAVALSFVRSGADVRSVRKFLSERGSTALIISKIETATAMKNIDDILTESDGIMVARGDLGTETPYEKLPLLQKKLTQKAEEMGKIFIIATEMLESMEENPVPTRAEVSDISEAIWQRSSAIMLSGETAIGEHPTQCVKVMTRVSEAIEPEVLMTRRMPTQETQSITKELARVAAQMSYNIPSLSVIVVEGDSGEMTRILSSFRPQAMIYMVTTGENVARKSQFWWGVNAVQTVDNISKIKQGGHYISLMKSTKSATDEPMALRIRAFWK